MTGKVYVHIGLPKTATTSLQGSFFPRLNSDYFEYIGTNEPRHPESQNPLYVNFYHMVRSGDFGELNNFQSKVLNNLNKGKSLLISEEMILLSESNITWHEKLINVNKILQGLDFTIVLTVREPASGLFSWYVQLIDRIYNPNRTFIETAMNEDSMRIFHYRSLLTELEGLFGETRISVIKYEDVIAGDFDLFFDLFGVEVKPRSPNIKKYNSRKEDEGHVYRSRTNLTDIIRGALIKAGVSDSHFVVALKKHAQPLIRLMNTVLLKKYKVNKPTVDEMQKLRKQLHSETAALEKYGVYYD